MLESPEIGSIGEKTAKSAFHNLNEYKTILVCGEKEMKKKKRGKEKGRKRRNKCNGREKP
jgi:hypothetical protein